LRRQKVGRPSVFLTKRDSAIKLSQEENNKIGKKNLIRNENIKKLAVSYFANWSFHQLVKCQLVI